MAALHFLVTFARVAGLKTHQSAQSGLANWLGILDSRANISRNMPLRRGQIMKLRRLRNRRIGFEALEARFALSAVTGLSNVAVHTEVGPSGSIEMTAQPTQKIAPIASTDVNWSGFAIPLSTTSVSYVAGSWTEPAVSSKYIGSEAIWVGIDGYTSNTVEQIGTETDIVDGQAIRYAWYEMYPAASVTIPNFTVNAGDSVTATVAYDSSQQNFVLTIHDPTQSETYTTTQRAPGVARSSAEWVVEAPATDNLILPLASFAPVTFTNAYATVDGVTGAIDNWQAYSMNIAFSSRGRTQTEALVSSFSDLTAATPLPTATPLETYSGDVSSFTVTRSAAVVANPPLSTAQRSSSSPAARNRR
jgi:hypothetical protein